MSTRKTVLVVDDDQDYIEFAQAALKAEYEILTANSGKECLDMVAKRRPDAIVLDVIMSHLVDGLDTAKALKENAATRDIPIVMLTSVNQHFDYTTQIDDSYFPRDRWLDKPVKPEVLLKTVQELIAGK
jgi:CheY-like chemotaxis protein